MIKDDEMQEQIDFLRAEIQNLRDRLTDNVGLPSPGTAGQGLFTDAARPYWGNVTVGTVTSVGATAPVVSSGGSTPVISMLSATGARDGYLTSADWTTFNNKQAAFAGTTAQYVRGDGSLATSVFGTVTSVGATAPVVSSGGATPTISMAAATSSVNGYLTSANWTTFNGKQAGATDLTTLSGFGAGTGYAKRTGSGTWSLNSTIATTDIYWTGTTGQYIRGDGSLATFSAGGGVWGSITGTLSSQTDLVAALALKGDLAGNNAWTGTQVYGSIYAFRYVQNATYTLGSTTPSTSNWYRVATLGHLDYGQEATIYLRFHRVAGNGESFYKFIIGKSTADGTTDTSFRYEMSGRYNATYGINNARVVDGGSNVASYLDIQMKTTDAFTMFMMANTVCVAQALETSLGWVSQGTGAAGTSFSVTNNLAVVGTTAVGVVSYLTTAGVSNFLSLGLPGTTGQYVRGDGSLATLPASGSGTVTSVNAAGGSTGLSFSGGPVTTSGTLTLAGTLAIANGGTGSGSAAGARSNLGAFPSAGGTFTGAITAPGVTDSSDIRFKTDVRGLVDGLAIISALKPVRFLNKLTGNQEVGFIAQDVRDVLPEIVCTDDNGDLAVAYQRITAPLVQALQATIYRQDCIDQRLAIIEEILANSIMRRSN